MNVDLPVPAGPIISKLEFVFSIASKAAICVEFKIGTKLFIPIIMPEIITVGNILIFTSMFVIALNRM